MDGMILLQFFVPYLSLMIMFDQLKNATTPEGWKFIRSIGLVTLFMVGLNFMAVILASMLRHYMEYGWI